MLEGLLHHKKEDKEFLSALVITEDQVDAALWEAGKDNHPEIAKTATVAYTGNWEAVINAADKTVSDIEEGLPEGRELTKVVFGFFPEWLDGDHIKEEYLKKLKQLTTALSLTPLGFVELPAAVVHLLHKEEGVQQTVILVGIENKHATISLYKIGKLVGTQTVSRTESIAGDLEKVLAGFTDVEVLPSRILLYGTNETIEKAKADLLNYPWQKKANFLHFPKIEALPIDFAVRAVAHASATEIMPQVVAGMAEVATPVVAPVVESKPEEVTPDEMTAIAEDLGFVKNEDSIKTVPINAEVTEKKELVAREEEIANVVPVAVPKPGPIEDTKPKMTLPKLPSLPKVNFSFHLPGGGLPNIPKIGILVVLIAVFLLGSVGVAGAFWLLPQATVRVLVKPQNLDQTQTIVVDEAATDVDTQAKVLPGKEVSEDVSGSKTTKTTGKKTIGDKAKGELTLYNKTLNSKSLKKGYILTAGKLNFTLDDDVSIASASEGLGSLTYGTVSVKVSANDIGTASNVPPATEFTLSDLPTTSYSARNEKAFAGGTSKDVAVVSREDIQRLRDETTTQLQGQAEAQLAQKLGSGEKLLDNSTSSKVVNETFSKEIGDEADELKLDLAVKSTGLTYKQSDFQKLVDSLVSGSIPANYEYKKEDAEISVTDAKQSTGGVHTFASHLKIKLLPKVEVTHLAQQLAGKTVSDATEFMRSQTSVSGLEVFIDAPLAFLKQKLPLNPAKIKIEISAL